MRARVLVPLYLEMAAVVTWPLVAHLPSSLPRGTEPVSTVPLFNLWTLRWNQLALGHLFRHYWDAPLFHPAAGALAFSEPQPLTGLVFTPLSALAHNPVLGYNLVLLGGLVLNGLAGHRLARTLGAAPVPAAATGALALALPFVAVQMGVLQLVMVFPLIFLIDAVLRWAPGGGRRRAAAMGLWLAVTFLTCGYYGLFASVIIAPAALTLVRRTWVSRDRAIDLALTVGVLAVLALPVVLAQAHLTSDFHRDPDTILALSAGGKNFWTLPAQAAGAGLLPWVGSTVDGQSLYPGTVLLVLAVAGMVVAAPRASTDRTDVDGRRRVVFLLTGLIIARLVSLGLKLDIGGFRPYDVLRVHVPGFASLRSPFRADVLTQIFLVGLAAYALDAGWRRLTEPPAAALAPKDEAAEAQEARTTPGRAPGPRARAGAVALAVALVALAVAETGIMPVPLHRVDTATPDWASYLDHHPPEGGPDADVLAFMPFPRTNGVASYQATVDHMLAVLDTGGTTVNGYSGLFPTTYDVLEEDARAYPNDETNALLRRYRVTAVVATNRWLDATPGAADALAEDFRPVFRGDDTTVFARR